MSALINSIIATILISLMSFLGALTLLIKKTQDDYATPVLVSFAAGVMLGAAFFSILPESFEEISTTTALTCTLCGIVLSFFIERFFLWHHHHHKDTRGVKPSAYLILFGDAVHNFIDGVAIMASFLISPSIGITTTIAIAAHEIPQELADFSILINAGMKKKQAIIFNLFSALTAVIGALISYWFLTSFEGLIPLALAFTGGMFIYIALADLIPELHSESGLKLSLTQSLPFILGIMLIYGIVLMTPHSHSHDEYHNDSGEVDYVVEDHSYDHNN